MQTLRDKAAVYPVPSLPASDDGDEEKEAAAMIVTGENETGLELRGLSVKRSGNCLEVSSIGVLHIVPPQRTRALRRVGP